MAKRQGREWPFKLPTSVRLHLLVGYIVVVVLLVGGTTVLGAIIIREQDRLELRMRERAEAVARVIDDELREYTRVLRLMVQSPPIQERRDAHVHAWSKEVAKEIAAYNIILTRDEHQVLNSFVPYGSALPVALQPNIKMLHDSLFKNERDVGYALARGPITGRWLLVVMVKVPGNGARQTLSATLDPVRLEKKLRQFAFSETEVALVMNEEGRAVIRSRDPTSVIGTIVGVSFLSEIRGENRGLWKGASVSNIPVVAGYSRSPLTGWVTRVGVTQEEFEAPMWQLYLLVALMFLVLVGLAFSRIMINRILRHKVRLAQTILKEFRHQTKNVASIFLAIADSTLREAERKTPPETYKEARRKIRDRVIALDEVHTLLSRHHLDQATLREILESQRRIAREGKLELEGPHVVLDGVLAKSLGLALFELLTNAVKHGALQNGGIARVSWEVRKDKLHITWQERGGPTLSPEAPRPRGYGTVSVEGLAKSQEGDVRWDYAPEGVTVYLTVKLPPA